MSPMDSLPSPVDPTMLQEPFVELGVFVRYGPGIMAGLRIDRELYFP